MTEIIIRERDKSAFCLESTSSPLVTSAAEELAKLPLWLFTMEQSLFALYSRTPLVIHVYHCDQKANQLLGFRLALEKTIYARFPGGNNVKIRWLTSEVVRKKRWRPVDFVNFMLNSHIHIILSHVHQGLDSLFWNMDEWRFQIARLINHCGFPASSNLMCPIFLQDKMCYIRAVPELCNNTLSVSLLHMDSQSEYSDDVKAIIERFVFFEYIHSIIHFTNSVADF